MGELVDPMTQKGMRFAPATIGNEASCTALHRAMATYAAGLPWESLRELRTSDWPRAKHKVYSASRTRKGSEWQLAANCWRHGRAHDERKTATSRGV